ncbi:hypothetical protein HMPREF3291_05265 [Bacillus sp. HMSC76G11]|nr:hypothetical protein HMPREF3291_05265 [Bacillus sp. HMSC76G11]
MELVTITLCVLITFIAYVLLSFKQQNKLIDQLLAKDYESYKLEERKDEFQKAQVLEPVKVFKEEEDKDYL